MLRYDRQTKPSLVALYDIWPGNGVGPFLQPRSPHGAILMEETVQWQPELFKTCANHLHLAPVKSYQHINTHFFTGHAPFCHPTNKAQEACNHHQLLLPPSPSPPPPHSHRFNGNFSRWIWVSRYQNVSILGFTGAENDGSGGDNWSYKTFKAQSNCHHQQSTPSFL